MVHKSWFVLPPAQEWYYKSKNSSYRELPPLRPDCTTSGLRSMELIYPRQFHKIYVPLELDGTRGKTVFEVAHRNPNTTIHWHLDNNYIGSTKRLHQMGLMPSPGEHIHTVVDEKGETLVQRFEVIGNTE